MTDTPPTMFIQRWCERSERFRVMAGDLCRPGHEFTPEDWRTLAQACSDVLGSTDERAMIYAAHGARGLGEIRQMFHLAAALAQKDPEELGPETPGGDSETGPHRNPTPSP